MITGAESVQNKTFGAPRDPPCKRCWSVRWRPVAIACRPDLCKNLLYNQSMTLLSEARLDGTISLHALEALLRDLVPLEGPKSMMSSRRASWPTIRRSSTSLAVSPRSHERPSMSLPSIAIAAN